MRSTAEGAQAPSRTVTSPRDPIEGAYDYVTVGHVTVDVLGPKRSRHPGGTAFYSALQAARLGLRTQIITQGNPPEIHQLLAPYRDEFDLTVLPAEHTTALRTWGEGPERHQRLLAWAGPIVGPIEVDTAILHLAPVARETPPAWQGRADFVGLTPQGLVRTWDAPGDITPAPLQRELLPARCDAIVLSATERACCETLIPPHPPLAGSISAPGETSPWDSAHRPLVAVTAGPHPTTLHLPRGEIRHVPVPPIETPTDDLGAGDVFAAALFIALREGHPPVAATAFANAAAAVRIAGAGPRAIGDRPAIQARLEHTARARSSDERWAGG